MSEATTMDRPVRLSVEGDGGHWNDHDSEQDAAEIAVLWNGILQDVIHFKTDGDDPFTFTVGEEPSSSFLIPEYALRGRTKVPLVEAEDGRLAVTALADSRCWVAYSDGTIIPVEGEQKFILKDRGEAVMELGPWTFSVRSSQPIEKFKSPLKIDLSSGYFWGVSAALHAVFFLLVYLVPPNAHGYLTDPNGGRNRFTKYMLTAPEIKASPVPEIVEKDQGGGEAGARHADDEGMSGKRDAPKTGKRMAFKGPPKNPDPHMARDMVKQMARSAGVLIYLSANQAPTSPFGRDTALGVDPENALGNLLGNQIANSLGLGGLGMKGTGRGGGGNGEGTIGVGSLNTIGHGTGGRGPGGPRAGRLIGEINGRAAKGPTPRPGTPTIRGSLSKEVIRRIVRRRLNEIKFCYDQGLMRRPDLSGRVSVRFLITGNGVVQGAIVDSSTIADPGVEACITKAVRRMTFPKPEDEGIVSVIYPFTLTSAEN